MKFTSKEHFLNQLNNPDEQVRFDALTFAEEEARKGSRDALFALVYALGDKEPAISGAAVDALSVILGLPAISDYALSRVKIEIGTQVVGNAKLEKIFHLLTEAETTAFRLTGKLHLSRTGIRPENPAAPIQKKTLQKA